MNTEVIEEFRAKGGSVGGYFEGATMVLVTHRGAKTGRRRTTPLVTLPLEDGLLIVASAGGADSHPAWFHNMLANPAVEVEYGAEAFTARATALTGGSDREALYARVVDRYPQFAGYQRATDRVIPLVKLERAA